MKYIRKIYDWTINISQHKNAAWFLGGLSFIESSFFPIPPDVTLIPMCLAKKEKSFLYATIATLGSSLGGLLGYAIGFFLFATIGNAILNFYGLTEAFTSFQNQYNEWGGWIVFAGGLTPIPYKVITIASGVTHMDITLFFVTSVLGRAMRFYLEAALLWKFGTAIKLFIEKYMGILSLLFFALLIGGFVILKYVF